MPEIGKRVLTAIIAAPLFLLATWQGGWFFWGLLLVINAVIQMEVVHMLGKQGLNTSAWAVFLLGIPILLMPVFPEWCWILFLLILLVLMIHFTLSRAEDVWQRTMATLTAGIFIPAFMSGLLLVREAGGEASGLILTFCLLVMIWANDIFAYAGGTFFGKHPLAPQISPAKTREGFIFGFVGSVAALILCMVFIPSYPLTVVLSIPFVLICGVVGPLGDLAESKLKRTAGIKDSSDLMPGHGGMYDRMDSLLASAPAVALYLSLLEFFSWL